MKCECNPHTVVDGVPSCYIYTPWPKVMKHKWVSDLDTDVEACDVVSGMGGWVDGQKLSDTHQLIQLTGDHRHCVLSFYAVVVERYPAPSLPHGGFYKQDSNDGVPILACGGVFSGSMRCWGDWMALIINQRDNTTKWGYIDFAWYSSEEYPNEQA